MLSREANSLYWMSRNLERAETNARILNVQLLQMLEASEEETLANHDWEVIFDICASTVEFESIRQNRSRIEETMIHYLTFSKQNPNSIAMCVLIARESARMSRNQLPDDLWEICNDLYLEGKTLRGEECSKNDLILYLQQTRKASLTARGILDSTMGRGPAYWIINIGKWLEQAEKTSRILNVVSDYIHRGGGEGFPNEFYYWRSSLQFVNGYEAFLKQFPPNMVPNTILRFLIADEAFPKSIRFCINHIRNAVHALEKGKVSHYSWELYASLDALQDQFDEVRINELNRNKLNDFLNEFQERIIEIGNIFSKTYYLNLSPPNLFS